ncbi:hypothetical protein CUU45_03470 [Pectobacterium polaris]|nr:hypothetical protein [Pectobacterium polaris]
MWKNMPLLIKPTEFQIYSHNIDDITKNIQVLNPDKSEWFGLAGCLQIRSLNSGFPQGERLFRTVI